MHSQACREEKGRGRPFWESLGKEGGELLFVTLRPDVSSRCTHTFIRKYSFYMGGTKLFLVRTREVGWHGGRSSQGKTSSSMNQRLDLGQVPGWQIVLAELPTTVDWQWLPGGRAQEEGHLEQDLDAERGVEEQMRC